MGKDRIINSENRTDFLELEKEVIQLRETKRRLIKELKEALTLLNKNQDIVIDLQENIRKLNKERVNVNYLRVAM